MSKQLTQSYLQEIFEYKDGELFWKVDRRKTKVGSKAGRKKSNGYCEIRVDGTLHGNASDYLHDGSWPYAKNN